MGDTALSRFRARVEVDARRTALRTVVAGGAPAERALSWEEWGEASRAFAAALVAAGHGPGETAAIWAGNGLEWPVADLGILWAGLVGMGLYPTSASSQVGELLADSDATLLLVDTPERLRTALALQPEVPGLRRIVVAEGTRPEGNAVPWTEWLDAGRRALRAGGGAAEALEARAADARPDGDAALIYTSGSTGRPKGARISHRYVTASAESIRDVLGLGEEDRALSFLPFCHAGERVFGLHTRILCGMEGGLVADPSRVFEAAREFEPTLFGAVPRHFEKLCDALRGEQEAAEGEERDRWEETIALGRRRSRLRQAGAPVPPEVERRWQEVGEAVLRRARSLLGGHVRRLSSGGARMPPEAAEYLDALGLTVLGAYGLTEHLCVAFNRPERFDFESCGPAMPGTELRMAGDGEILVRRGDLTFSGYLGLPDETRDAFTEDGEWLRTGDLGELDARGFLRVTGRKKELVALSTGKKVAVGPIEAELAAHPWIEAAVAFGEGRKFLSAVLVPRRPAVERWGRERGLGDGWPELLRHPDVRARFQAAVDAVNGTRSRTEGVRAFVLLERELSVEAGDLTATGKVRRFRILEGARNELETVYA